MKLHGLKRHLRGLICVCILSVLLVSCAGKEVVSPLNTEVFSPEYYMLKKADPIDYTKLQGFLSSQNEGTKAAAGLILGYYYLRDGHTAKASVYINEHYANPGLSDFMKKMGELWQMELNLAESRYSDAENWAAAIELSAEAPEDQRALETYCITMRLYPKSGSGVYGCVTERLAKYREGSTDLAGFDNGSGVIADRNINNSPLYSGILNILVVSSGDIQDVSGGIYFYNKTHDMNHKIRFSKTFREGDWDFVLDLDNGYLGGRGYGIYFKPDLSGLLENIQDYLDLRCTKVIIGSGRGLSTSAGVLRKKFEANGAVVKVTDITDESAARSVRGYLAEWDRQQFCAIGAGTEDEINNFVPTVRQYVSNAAQQRIYILKDIDTGKHLTRDYIGYYTGTRVLPLMDLSLSGNIKEFSAEYEAFSGRSLTYEALMGYDMMHYINSRTVEGAGSSEPYLTNITGAEDGKVTRDVKGFYISTKGIIDELTINKPGKNGIGADGIGSETE